MILLLIKIDAERKSDEDLIKDIILDELKTIDLEKSGSESKIKYFEYEVMTLPLRS